jgi:ABC transporter, permease/ATP-binding protein
VGKTLIGSKGVHLSGGEVQRIAIARAILKNAPIIILDEASAATDPENEYEIQQAFSALMKDKTVIMIAHRLSSIKKVDEILVIENGNIIERGNDETLQKQAGKYKTLQDLFSKANTWRIYDK